MTKLKVEAEPRVYQKPYLLFLQAVKGATYPDREDLTWQVGKKALSILRCLAEFIDESGIINKRNQEVQGVLHGFWVFVDAELAESIIELRNSDGSVRYTADLGE